MDEIEKLGKEEDTSYSFKKILGPKRTYDIKGYRGFLDLGYTTGDDGCIQFTTSHGYQLNPYFFFGAGTGVSYFTDSESAFNSRFRRFTRELYQWADSSFYRIKDWLCH